MILSNIGYSVLGASTAPTCAVHRVLVRHSLRQLSAGAAGAAGHGSVRATYRQVAIHWRMSYKCGRHALRASASPMLRRGCMLK